MNASFILVGNFQTLTDRRTGDFENAPSGMDMTCFYCNMRAFAEVHGLEIVDYQQNSVVIAGDAATLDLLRKQTDDAFSYICLNRENMTAVTRHEYEAPSYALTD